MSAVSEGLSKTLRWRAPALIVVGAFWLGQAATVRADAQYWDPRSALDYTAVVLFSAALLGSVIPLFVLWQADNRQSVVGRIGLLGSAIGVTLAGVANLAEDAGGISFLGSWAYLPGILTAIVSLPLLAVAALRAARPVLGWGALLAFVGFWMISFGGGALVGVLIATLGVHEARRRTASS